MRPLTDLEIARNVVRWNADQYALAVCEEHRDAQHKRDRLRDAKRFERNIETVARSMRVAEAA